MKPPDRTVARWIAEGETTIALFCNARGCGHHATLDITVLPPKMARSQIIRRARCSACGSRDIQLMRDMAAHYERLEATGWSCEPKPWPGNEKPRRGEPGGGWG